MEFKKSFQDLTIGIISGGQAKYSYFLYSRRHQTQTNFEKFGLKYKKLSYQIG